MGLSAALANQLPVPKTEYTVEMKLRQSKSANHITDTSSSENEKGLGPKDGTRRSGAQSHTYQDHEMARL